MHSKTTPASLLPFDSKGAGFEDYSPVARSLRGMGRDTGRKRQVKRGSLPDGTGVRNGTVMRENYLLDDE
jgi:hypothetical protein